MSKKWSKFKINGCVFCGEDPLTDEHVFSDWLKRIMPPQISHATVHRFQHWDSQKRFTTIDHETDQRQGSLFQRTVKVVCEPCNNGWMSRAVEKAKPAVEALANDERIVLTPALQASLALWVSLTRTMAEFTDTRTLSIPASDREFLYKNLLSPELWTIYIGRYTGRATDSGFYHHSFRHFLPKSHRGPGKPKTEITLATTFVLKHFAFFIFSSTKDATARAFRGYEPPLGATHIWPPRSGDIPWPCTYPQGDDWLESISHPYPDHFLLNIGPGRPN